LNLVEKIGSNHVQMKLARIVFLLGMAVFSNSVQATAGLAEWELQTPGTNLISHLDPFIAEYGTCLRPADKRKEWNREMYVVRIDWWQYYKGHVVGKARKGFFIFDELSNGVSYFRVEENFDCETKNLGGPLTRRLTAQDGWKLTWGPVMREGFERIKKSDEYKKMTEDQQCAIDSEIEMSRDPDLKPVSP
jgi:hypothetical protein